MVNLSGVLIGIQREIEDVKNLVTLVIVVIAGLVLLFGSALLIIYFQSIINFVIAMYLWLNLIGLCVVFVGIIGFIGMVLIKIVKGIVRAVKNLFHKLIELLRGSG